MEPIKRGFRSGFEERCATELQLESITFEYESEKIRYTRPSKPCTYTPDLIFRVKRDGQAKQRTLFVELKGRFLTADRQKHLLIRDQFPNLDIRFVFQNPNSKISKRSKTTYAMWCDKHGFKYAKGSVPLEWIDED